MTARVSGLLPADSGLAARAARRGDWRFSRARPVRRNKHI